MSMTLLVIQGPYAGQQIPVGVGQVFRVGRTDRSELALPNDTYLSGTHLEIGCDEQGCWIRDLGSSNGTFVNGARIEQAAVREGDQISAGETVFLVQAASHEQVTLAKEASPIPTAQLPAIERTARMYAPGFEPAPQPQQPPLTDERKRALHILTHHGAPLFVVMDAAREGAAELLQPARLRYQQLFDSQAAAHIPVLVDLGPAGAAGAGTDQQTFLEALLRSGWGKDWCIFCASLSPFEDLLAHFRSFLLAPIRFYHPRVLRALLPTCEPAELRTVFGPVTSYVMESERPDMMLAFSPGADRLITAQVSLAEPAARSQAQAG